MAMQCANSATRGDLSGHSTKVKPQGENCLRLPGYKDRNRIERMFNKVKQFRRIATRYDKTKASFAAFLNLAAARIWLQHFVNRA